MSLESKRQDDYYQRIVRWVDPGYYFSEPSTQKIYRLQERTEDGVPQRFGKEFVLETVFGPGEGERMVVRSDQVYQQLLEGAWTLKDSEQGRGFLAHKRVGALGLGQTIVNLRSGTRRSVAELSPSETAFTLEIESGERKGDRASYRDYQIVKGLILGIIEIQK